MFGFALPSLMTGLFGQTATSMLSPAQQSLYGMAANSGSGMGGAMGSVQAPGEDSLSTLAGYANMFGGGSGGYGNAAYQQGLSSYKDMSQYANPASLMNMLNAAGPGQQPYQDFIPPYMNPYIMSLMG